MKSSPRAAQLYPFCLQQWAWKQFGKTQKLSWVWFGSGKVRRWESQKKITQMSHIYRKQSICGNREEKAGNPSVGETSATGSLIGVGRTPMVQRLWKTGWQVFYKVTYIIILWSSNSSPRYLPKKNQDVYSHQGLSRVRTQVKKFKDVLSLRVGRVQDQH